MNRDKSLSFDSIALLRSHQQLPAFMNYLISDLTELAGLGAAVQDLVSDISIPVSPVDRDPLAGFEAFMARKKPGLVGISAFTCGAKSAQAYAEVAKRYGAYVVLGGYHPSALPDEVLSCPDIDAVVRGEGEATFRDLVQHGPSKDVLGLSFKANGTVVHAGERPVIENLDTLPLPNRALRPKRFGRVGDDYHVDSVYTSRGCRARCTFCANHLVGKQWRERSQNNVIEELESIKPGSIRRPKLIKLWDPNFMTDIQRTADLCQAIIDADLHLRFRFVAETRLGDIHRGRDILELMAKAGFIRLGTGIESPNAETLRLVKKGSSGSATEAADLLRAHGITLEKFYIIGLPNEGEEDFLRYADAATDGGAWKQNAHFFVLTPYPGTVTYDELEKEGQITSKDWDLYNNYMATIEPAGIPQLRLQALQAAVTMRYSVIKRFQRGVPFRKLVFKLFTVMMALTKAVQQQRGFSRDDQIECMWTAIELIGEIGNRPISGKARFLDSLQFKVYRKGQRPLIFSQSRRNGQEHAACSAEEVPGGVTFHVSLDELFAMAEGINLRKGGHDVLTLRLSPLSMTAQSIAGTVGLLAKIGCVGLRTVGFHFGRILRPAEILPHPKDAKTSEDHAAAQNPLDGA